MPAVVRSKLCSSVSAWLGVFASSLVDVVGVGFMHKITPEELTCHLNQSAFFLLYAFIFFGLNISFP